MVQDHQKTSSELKAKNGKDFDGSYDQIQLKAHQDAVALFEAYAKGGDNAELKGWALARGDRGGGVYPASDRRSCRPMLASCLAWGGTLSALRPHHLSITLIARCIAKYRSPDTFPCFGAGVYTVHTHSSLPSALLSSYRTPRCSMMHPASAPRAIHEF